MSPEAVREARGGPRFPRVSGDEPDCGSPVHFEYAFSPRERG